MSRTQSFLSVLAISSTVTLMACASASTLPEVNGFGPSPHLPEPDKSLIPIVNVAKAVGWPDGAHPAPAAGTPVVPFAKGFAHPRWLHVLPNGDVLVAETNTPARPVQIGGIKGWFLKRYQKKAGGAAPTANRISLLRDADGDGTAEIRTAFLTNLNSPFGMALVGNTLFIANSDAVVKVSYSEGSTEIRETPQQVAGLPVRKLDHHWTKSLIASVDGRKLYVALGSNSNVGENGMDNEAGRAAIWELEIATGTHRMFATGLRNPVGMA